MDNNTDKKTVTVEDITISNMYEIEAIIRVLEKKGLLTHGEVLEELQRLRVERDQQ